MARTRRSLLAAAGASLALAGCTGGTTGGDGDDAAGSATVQVRSHDDFGDILVDGDGMTLYRFDADEGDGEASACHDDCAEAWPPLTVTEDPIVGSDVSAELATFARADGSTQVAASGWPLYYFDSDGAPGDTAGQGVNEVWWVLAPDGSKITATDSSGRTY